VAGADCFGRRYDDFISFDVGELYQEYNCSLFKLLAWAVAEAPGLSFDLHDSGLAPCWCGILNPELLSTVVIYKM